eukprot:2635003-Rhodomonas_salina.3
MCRCPVLSGTVSGSSILGVSGLVFAFDSVGDGIALLTVRLRGRTADPEWVQRLQLTVCALRVRFWQDFVGLRASGKALRVQA